MPPRGFLYVIYYSGEGKHLQGTLPNLPVRKSLFHLVGITEDDFLMDECNLIYEKKIIETEHGQREIPVLADKIYSVPEGTKSAMDNKKLWEVFLTPLNSSSARIARGEKVLAIFDEMREKACGKDPYNLHNVTLPKSSAAVKQIVSASIDKSKGKT